MFFVTIFNIFKKNLSFFCVCHLLDYDYEFRSLILCIPTERNSQS